MDFMAHFTMGTGGHYITMLPADCSISPSHDPLPSSCHSEKMLWNPSIWIDLSSTCPKDYFYVLEQVLTCPVELHIVAQQLARTAKLQISK